MDFVNRKLSKKEISGFQNEYGDYVKLTIDVEKGWVMVGCILHADGEKILLEKGSRQNDIWGGGINLLDKLVDTTAVLNIRPNLKNDNLEILDQGIREKFIKIVKDYFNALWS